MKTPAMAPEITALVKHKPPAVQTAKQKFGIVKDNTILGPSSK